MYISKFQMEIQMEINENILAPQLSRTCRQCADTDEKF